LTSGSPARQGLRRTERRRRPLRRGAEQRRSVGATMMRAADARTP